MTRMGATVALLACLAVSAGRAEEQSGLAAAAAIEDAFVKAIESAEPSIVSISRERIAATPAPPAQVGRRGFPMGGLPGGTHPPTPESLDFVPNEFGAGIVIDEAGLILTNYHVVRGGPPFEARADLKSEQTLHVRLADRRSFEARIYAADPRSDLAVLKIPANNLKPIRMGNATHARKGQLVIALGNPYAIARDGSPSASWGIIGNLYRRIAPDWEQSDPEGRRKETIQHLGVLMQVDTRLELGTSGGALLNLKGELIGVTTSQASITGYERSAGFALPIDDNTRRVIDTLRQGKEVEYGFLGIVPEDALPSEFTGELAAAQAAIRQNGAARINSVVSHLPAERFGIQEGDLVFRVGERPIYGQKDLMREIGMLAPGATVRIQVWRPSRASIVSLDVEVGKWPVQDEEGLIISRPLRESWRGLDFDYPTARFRTFKVNTPRLAPERYSGVSVVNVASNSPGSAADLRPEDVITHVNGLSVHSPRELADKLRGETGNVSLQIIPASTPQGPARTIEVRAK